MNENIEWKKVDEHLIRDGYRKIIEKTFIFPNGKEKTFEIKKEGVSGAVLALTENNEVILAKQYRPGPEKILYEIPGGGVSPGEDPEAAIKRELLEETGYSGNFTFVSSFVPGAYTTGVKYCFVATRCHKIKEPEPDESEFIEVILIPLADFKKHLKTGLLSDIHIAYLGLDHLGLLG